MHNKNNNEDFRKKLIMDIIEVFKTNVQNSKMANFIISFLQKEFPNCRINFDLEDCDKILRIEGNGFINEKIITHLNDLGFMCMEL
ncbi:hypothetical protein D3C85_1554560 [compost metagenome]